MRLLNHNVVELTTINELTKDVIIKNKEGKKVGIEKKVIKRNVPLKMTFYKRSCFPSEHLDKNGKGVKDKCFVFDDNSKVTYLIKGSYSDALIFFFSDEHKTVKGLST